MPETAPKSCTAFAGHSRIAGGSLAEVALAAKSVVDRGDLSPLLIFDDATSQPIEIDFRGTPGEVIARLSGRFPGFGSGSRADASNQRKAGRPNLGVVGREITLLPRHWEWLARQSGGASVTVRRLIDAERKASGFKDLARKSEDVTYRFLNSIAGNFPHFEDALRALFASDRNKFIELTEAWPADIRDHARWLMTGGAETSDAEIGA
jgi:hypothetical protein